LEYVRIKPYHTALTAVLGKFKPCRVCCVQFARFSIFESLRLSHFLTAMYQKNQAVEAYYDDGWYGGIIHKLNDDGTFVVHFDDGDVADDIRLDEIRLPQNGTEGNNGFEEDDDDDPFGDEIKPQRKTIVSSILLTCP
jgi:hypothetical protein